MTTTLRLTLEQITAHQAFLSEHVYQTDTKWPHFSRLLKDVQDIATQVQETQTVVCLERAYVYGGNSLFAPLFTRGKFIAVDTWLDENEHRGAYQGDWVQDSRCFQQPADLQSTIAHIDLPDGSADWLMVPNIVHHVRDQDAMVAEFARLLKPGGIGYIFETLLRELHQAPYDYIRYTPCGMEEVLARHGLTLTRWEPAGGPFEAIAYCWTQALQYLPEPLRTEKERWFYQEHFPQLMAWDQAYPNNQVRQHTSFPVAFGFFFQKESP
jgi:SAM-dependent methyltransferase